MTGRTFAHGALAVSTDSWLLVERSVIVLDVTALDDFAEFHEHQEVSVVGTSAQLHHAPGQPPQPRIAVERMVSQDTIRTRAFELFRAGELGSAEDHWLHAERELLTS